MHIPAHGHSDPEPWRLTAHAAYPMREISSEERTESADLRLSFRDVTYVWMGDSAERGTVALQKGRIDIDAVATR